MASTSIKTTQDATIIRNGGGHHLRYHPSTYLCTRVVIRYGRIHISKKKEACGVMIRHGHRVLCIKATTPVRRECVC